MRSPKLHWYMCSVTVFYKRDGGMKQRTMNSLAQSGDKAFNYVMLDNIRQASLKRMQDENNVEPNDVADFVVNNISYCGHMTAEEWEGKKPKNQRTM